MWQQTWKTGARPSLMTSLSLRPSCSPSLGPFVCVQCRLGGPAGMAGIGITPPVSLLVILAKYGLDGRKDARAVSSNSLSDPAEEDSLEDPRLEKLWHKVP